METRAGQSNHRGRRSGYRRYAVYLIYLLFVFTQPLFDPTATVFSWVFAGALIAAFAPLYLWTASRIDDLPVLRSSDGAPGALLGVLAMFAMALVAAPFNSGASGFLIYAAAVVGHLQPRRRALAWLGVTLALVLVCAVLSSVPWPFALYAFAPALFFVPVLGLTTINETERRCADLRLSMAQDEIGELAAIAERERIARDLHDLLGHTLSSITLKAELASKLAARDGERAAEEMRDVERISREALAQVRSAVRGYRSQGLQGEVANAKLAFEASGIAFDYYVEPLGLTADREGVLALALREAVTNVVRHARASASSVRLRREGTRALLVVEDDGVGGADVNGNGLSTMRARLQTLGGTLDVVPLARGTQLRVTMPIGSTLDAALPADVAPAT